MVYSQLVHKANLTLAVTASPNLKLNPSLNPNLNPNEFQRVELGTTTATPFKNWEKYDE